MEAPEAGQLVTPNLRLVRALGAGGMGSVWVARHLGLGTDVVVKFIAGDLASNGEALERFRREAAAAADVRSPHVVQILDYGISMSGAPYIAMELLEGESLRERLTREGRLRPRDVAAIVSHCAKALGRAHERRVVHRDVKPDNVFLIDAGDGEVFAKVLDFGIAKAEGGDMVATRTGAVLGSPYYMSPEQVVGSRQLDHRSDLWSLGVMTYEMITGRRPFDGETIGALSIAICYADIPPPSQFAPELPPTVDAWFSRACARDPAARFASARELAEALTSALAQVPDPGHADPVAAQPRGSPLAPTLTATAPLSTTAGIGIGAAEASAPPAWQKWAIVAGIVCLGALGGIAAWAFRSPGAPGQSEGSSASETAPSMASKKVEPTVPETVAAPAVTSAATALPSVASVPKPVTSPAQTATQAPKKSISSASAAPTTTVVPSSRPKVDHDPNLF